MERIRLNNHAQVRIAAGGLNRYLKTAVGAEMRAVEAGNGYVYYGVEDDN